MTLELLLRWAVSLLIVTVLPGTMGAAGQPLWLFLVYAVAAGSLLTVAEDPRYARAVRFRADVRSYLLVRIAIVAACGILPFLIARALAG